MLKIISDNGKTTIESAGTIADLTCDLSAAIHKIWMAFGKRDRQNANAFKKAMQCLLMDNSPVWEFDEGQTDRETCLSRDPSEPVKAEDIQKMIRNGATPEQIARYCGGVE